jgi:hypothetical protein
LAIFSSSPKNIDEQKARYMLENAVFSPEQAFKKYKSFYMKTERTVHEAFSAGRYINGLNKEAYGMNSLFENKVVQELYVQDDKIRFSCYVDSLTTPAELHLIYDGNTLWAVSNFAVKDGMQMTFKQAEDYIGFPGPDSFKRLRSKYEQSGKEIWYKYAGVQKYEGYRCDIIEMGLKEDDDSKAVFFIDRKTNIVIKTEWPGIFYNIARVKKIGKMHGEKVPQIAEVFYGEYFTAVLKYSVKLDEYIHPDIFNEASILLPLRSAYQDVRFQREKPQRRRARIRLVLDSVRSFGFVLHNMHLANYDNDKNAHPGAAEIEFEAINLPELEKEKRLIPDNVKDYRIPIASEEAPKPEAKKKLSEKPQPKKTADKKTSEIKKPVVNGDDANDETDLLEYSPRDAYKSIEAELEDMKEKDPEGYEKMKKIVEEMKAKDANVKNMSY